MSETNKNAYKQHQYSGSRKNLNRVRAALKRFHEETTRAAVWRKGEQPTNEPLNQNICCDDHSITPKIPRLKTYQRKKPSICKEAVFRAASTSTAEPVINWPQPDPEIDSHILTIETVPTYCLSGISGFRIVDLKHVIQWAFLLERHRNECKSSQIEFVCELHNGFHSNLTFKCSMCDKIWKLSTAQDDKINTSFVWATVTAGSYYTQAAHITSLMNIPTMAAKKFPRIENQLGKVWSEHLTEEIKNAGKEERSIAIEKGHVTSDGVPYITVYVDGGWLKRSYGHNFDSPSGMACIIGKETKKCLYLGVRNKYCYTCQYYERRNMDVKAHGCCKNYTGPSTAMESQIIVEGFQKSEEIHKLRYLNFVGDGDSSVFANLKEKVSYGSQIKKIECKNHVIKNYTSALYKILSNTKLPLYGRNILKPKLMKLTQVARKIIVRNSDEPVVMAAELRNGPLHVFGDHEKCKDYYCNLKTMPAHEIQDKQVNLVENLKNTAPEVWALIYAANERIVLKSGRLSNETTNVAENFMSIINKFNCGKRLSLAKGGSYQRRVYVAGLSHSTGHKWHASAWPKHTNQSPGQHFQKYILRKEKSRLQQQSFIRKRLFTHKVKSRPDKHYGPEACDPADINEVELRTRCEERLAEFQKTALDIVAIEMATIGQHDNDLYVMHRHFFTEQKKYHGINLLHLPFQIDLQSDTASQFGMVSEVDLFRDIFSVQFLQSDTASQFGMVCKRRNTTPCHNHVKAVLYKNNICTKDMVYGQQNEIVARTIFIQQYHKNVRPSGIIDDEKAVVEIKCFPSLSRRSESLEQAAREKKYFALQVENNMLVMNKKHDYYYQVQGQLRVTRMDKCYFICFISVTQPLTVIEVSRDDEFIASMMTKLVMFFKTCVLPEIILRRVQKNSKCIDFSSVTVKNLSST